MISMHRLAGSVRRNGEQPRRYVQATTANSNAAGRENHRRDTNAAVSATTDRDGPALRTHLGGHEALRTRSEADQNELSGAPIR